MGTFCGSLHVRTEDRAAVQNILESVAKRRRIRFWLGPVVRGWVSVYPERAGQDASLAKVLAKQMLFDAIYVSVHADDVFVYEFYRSGKLVDQYNSTPDYFEAVSARQKARLRGKPERLADLLISSVTVEDLRQLLAPEPMDLLLMKSDALRQFASFLGLPNALNSYEDLEAGELESPEELDAFLHVPDRSGELAQWLAESAALREAKQRLITEGSLLLDDERPIDRSGCCLGGACINPVSQGFLAAWKRSDWMQSSEGEARIPLLNYAAPNWGTPNVSGIELAPTLTFLSSSPSGEYLAVGHAYGNWKAEVWSTRQADLLFQVPCDRSVVWVGFTGNEDFVATVSHETTVVASVKTSKIVRCIPIGGGITAAMHPDGWLVVSQEKMKVLSIIDPLSGEIKRIFSIATQPISALESHVPSILAEFQKINDTKLFDVQNEIENNLKTSSENFENNSNTILELMPSSHEIQKQVGDQINHIQQQFTVVYKEVCKSGLGA